MRKEKGERTVRGVLLTFRMALSRIVSEMRNDERSKSRGQTCLYYALQGGRETHEVGLNEKGERRKRHAGRYYSPQGLSHFSFLLSPLTTCCFMRASKYPKGDPKQSLLRGCEGVLRVSVHRGGWGQH